MTVPLTSLTPPPADPILVPESWRDRPVRGLPISGRLFNALSRRGCHLLGDLDGRDFAELREPPPDGEGVVEELRGLLARAAEVMADTAGEAMLPTGIIVLPEAAWGCPLLEQGLSVRLGNVCDRAGLRRLGDLHGRSYEEFSKLRNCGRRSVAELARIVARAQAAAGFAPARETVEPGTAPEDGTAPGSFQVPAFARDWPLTVLPVSVRLANLLEAMGCRELGGLHGRLPAELLGRPNCGRKTLAELATLLDRVRAGDFSPPPAEAPTGAGEALRDLPALVRYLDGRVPLLPARTREVLLARLGGDGAADLPTLEEVGARFGVTRERIRQLVNAAVEHLRRDGGPRLAARLGRLADHCQGLAVPLTPELLARAEALAGASGNALPAAFYLRLLDEMEPRLPVWPAGRDGGRMPEEGELELRRDLHAWLLARDGAPAPLNDALAALRAEYPSQGGLTVTEFLEALRNARAAFRVSLDDPERPLVALVRMSRTEWVCRVLRDSAVALTPEEIIARGRALPGVRADLSPDSFFHLVSRPVGIYLLGPRRLGLRAHFQLPEGEWETARADFAALLDRENRPVSTAEVVHARSFAWTERTNAHELAEILAGDAARFTDLGKFLFARRDWGVEERQHVADLVPEILRAAGHPLSTTGIADRLQRLRSVSTGALSAWLGRMAGVRDLGFGYWGETAADEDADRRFLAGEADYVNRAVSRAGPPLTFARLCERLQVPVEGPAAARLWATLGGLPRVRLSASGPAPDPAARLAHERWRLEDALLDLLAGAGEPLPLHELQWRLRDRCPFAFAGRQRVDQLERALHRCPGVTQAAAGRYFLAGSAGPAGEEADGLRARCEAILGETDALLRGEDLLERLSVGGAAGEQTSLTRLVACLRVGPAFEEVGHHRFRLRRTAGTAQPPDAAQPHDAEPFAVQSVLPLSEGPT